MRRFLPRRQSSSEKYRSFGTLWTKVFVLLALGGGWAVFALAHPAGILGNLLTATIASASLIYSLGRGQEATKDQYTLSLVAKRFDEGHYAENVRIAGELYRSGRLTPDTTLKDLLALEWQDKWDERKGRLAGYAVIPLLNYWEHVCTAYVDNRINRRIFEDLVQDLIRELVARYPQIIGDMRGEDPSNMEHLCAVWFALASDEERRKHAPRLGPVPQRLCAHDQWCWERAGGKSDGWVR